MAKKIRKHMNPVEEDVMKANILSDLYDYFAYKTNPAHADTDHKYRLRKCIKFFTVDGGKLY